MPRKVTLKGQRYTIAPTRDEEVLKVIKEDGQTYYLSKYGCSCPGFVFSLLRRGKGACKHFRERKRLLDRPSRLPGPA